MKLNILYALLSGATAVTAGPPPPSSSDVCAKAGVEIDPTSMATFEGSFHIKAQAKTFTGPQPGDAYDGLTFTLKDNHLHTLKGLPVKWGGFAPRGQLVLWPTIGRDKARKYIRFEARRVCDPTTKREAIILDLASDITDDGFYFRGPRLDSCHGAVTITESRNPSKKGDEIILRIAPV